MDLGFLSEFRDLGLGAIAVILVAYLTRYVMDKNFQVFKELISQLKEIQINYTNFVTENNHQKTDMVKEHTSVMMEVKTAIVENTKSTENYNKTLERLVDRLNRI